MVTAKKIEEMQGMLRALISDLEELKRDLPDFKEAKFVEKEQNVVDMLRDLSKGSNL